MKSMLITVMRGKRIKLGSFGLSDLIVTMEDHMR